MRPISLLILALSLVSVVARAQTVTEQVIFSFPAGNSGEFDNINQTPASSPVPAFDGNFYGTTLGWGSAGYPTIYKVTPQGAFTTLQIFADNTGGPTELYQNSVGNFYGLCSTGLCQMTPSGTFSPVSPLGLVPTNVLVPANDGYIYGTTTMGGDFGCGSIYRISPTGQVSTYYTFPSVTNFTGPETLIQGSDGNFYGAVFNGGAYRAGMLFKLVPPSTIVDIHDFKPGLYDNQAAFDLIEGPDGDIYGETAFGGTYGEGSLFKISPSGAFSTLHSFNETADGAAPLGIIFGSDGKIYGTLGAGGNSSCSGGCGTFFQFDLSSGFKVLYSFTGTPNDALNLYAPFQFNDGDFYGAAEGGGQSGTGEIYKLALTPALAPPVKLSLSSSQVAVDSPVTLDWQISNAFSLTMQQCYAFVQGGASGAGAWQGKQAGTYNSSTHILSGSEILTPSQPGIYTYALTCGGIENGWQRSGSQESGFATLTVTGPTKSNTATALAAPLNPATVGQAVTLNTTVASPSGIPAGTVTLRYGSIVLNTAPLNSFGTTSFTRSTSTLPAGNYPITATYSGNSSYAASTSTPYVVELGAAPTTTTLTSSSGFVVPPNSLTLTASVARSTVGATGVPQGKVTFYADGAVLGTATLNSAGVATFSASAKHVPIATYSLKAKYSGGASDQTSTSVPISVVVN